MSGGYLTLYQLALIEAGNLNALVLGRFRVIDRLQSTPRESVYRVFDPRQTPDGNWSAANTPAATKMLRLLGEAETADPVRPDEYRQRFAALRELAHPNVAATLETPEILGRPGRRARVAAGVGVGGVADVRLGAVGLGEIC